MRPVTLRERAGLALAFALRRVANACLLATFRIDLSKRNGKTARPGQPNSMTRDEVELFAFLHGIGYPPSSETGSGGMTRDEIAEFARCQGIDRRPAPVPLEGGSFLVEEERTIVDHTSGFSATLRAGKIVTARTHDIEDLRRQGVQLRELPPPEPPAPAPEGPAPELEEAPA